jgi:hypothetical protein
MVRRHLGLGSLQMAQGGAYLLHVRLETLFNEDHSRGKGLCSEAD